MQKKKRKAQLVQGPFHTHTFNYNILKIPILHLFCVGFEDDMDKLQRPIYDDKISR